MRKRCWRRWVSIGPRSLRDLCRIARGHGLEIVVAFKWDMHFFNCIGLYGTAAAVAAAVRDWEAADHEVEARRPGAGNDFSVRRTRADWAETRVDWINPA